MSDDHPKQASEKILENIAHQAQKMESAQHLSMGAVIEREQGATINDELDYLQASTDDPNKVLRKYKEDMRNAAKAEREGGGDWGRSRAMGGKAAGMQAAYDKAKEEVRREAREHKDEVK